MHGWQHVTVGVEGDRDRRMSEDDPPFVERITQPPDPSAASSPCARCNSDFSSVMSRNTTTTPSTAPAYTSGDAEYAPGRMETSLRVNASSLVVTGRRSVRALSRGHSDSLLASELRSLGSFAPTVHRANPPTYRAPRQVAHGRCKPSTVRVPQTGAGPPLRPLAFTLEVEPRASLQSATAASVSRGPQRSRHSILPRPGAAVGW